MLPKVSVIILNWNGKDLTIECLNSLEKLKYMNYEVVVVDNGSTDGSQKAIKEKFPRVKLIENKENVGFAEGNNIGIRNSDADYFLLLNNDTVVDPYMLDELVDVGESDPKIGILCPKIYLYDKKDVFWFAGGYLRTYGTLHRGYNEKDVGQYDKVEDMVYASGCAFMIKKEVTEKIGLLDKEFFIYLEDVDYSLRAKENGFRVVYVPKAKMWHKCYKTMGKPEEQEKARFLGERNILLLAYKHNFNMPIFILLDLLHVIGLIPILILKGRFNEIKGVIRAKIWFLKRYLITRKM